MIITGYDEPMMEVEAGRYGAEFIKKPISPAEFLEACPRALHNVRRERRWPRKRIVGGFRVTAAGQPAAVVDVCYGGLRLEIPAGQSLPRSFDVEVAGIDLHLRWSRSGHPATRTHSSAAPRSPDTTPAAAPGARSSIASPHSGSAGSRLLRCLDLPFVLSGSALRAVKNVGPA